MKRGFIYILFLFFSISGFAQNTLTIHQKDGKQFSYGFEDKPVISYTDSTIVLKSTRTEILFPLSNLLKFTFSDVDSTINAIGNNSTTAKLALNNSFICINGAGPNVSVFVIGVDGKALFEYKTDPDGTITFSIAELPEGVYIIKSENITCKILKK